MGSAEGMALDCSSLADVRRFAASFLEKHPKLNMLVLNAGSGNAEEPVTADGFEVVYATNYLGSFLLLNLLLPALEATDGDVRITATSSFGHWQASPDIEDLLPGSRSATTSQKGLILKEPVYNNSKLALILMCFDLQRKLGEGSQITVTPVNPGVVASAIWTPESRGQDVNPEEYRLLFSPKEGAATTLYALLAPDM